MPVPESMKAVKVGRVAHITIDHPPLNTINTEIWQQLARDVLRYEADDSVRVILLDSANQKPPFAADGAALLADPGWQAQFEMLREGQRALTAIEFPSNPVVMAIYDGVCMGGGLELALSCHIRVAGSGTLFAVPEAPAGAMPGWGNAKARPTIRRRLLMRSRPFSTNARSSSMTKRSAQAKVSTSDRTGKQNLKETSS